MKKENKPQISVVMSTYKEPLEWITESIESILNQTFGDFEFIIINDNPKRKELRNFLKNYVKKDKRIKIINSKKNEGPAFARNKGLKIAKGKYIAIMDADDISLPKRFEIQYNYLEKHKDIFLASGCAINVDEFGKEISRHYIIPFPKIISWKLKKKNCLYHPTIMFRNEKNNFYNENLKYAQDYGLYLSLMKKNKKMTGIPKFLLKYRVNSKSITGTKKREQSDFAKLAKNIYLD